MFADERYEIILSKLNEAGSITVSELVNTFDVSIETVRRDLCAMEKKGALKRVHGGAVTVNNRMKEFKKVSLRISEYTEEKEELSRYALRFVEKNDIIAIDSGSTAEVFAKTVADQLKNITVVTHSLNVFMRLKENRTINSILIGGQFLESENSFFGELAIGQLKQLHVSKAFVTPSAVSLKHGIWDYITELVGVQKTYTKVADRVIILADSSKFEKTALMKICDSSDSDIIVTDSRLDSKIRNQYLRGKINLVTGD
jgi:DeoR/GlpR family transcriptional regulator of sugar metabolism